MLHDFQKDRPRLLLICKNVPVRNSLVTLLTGYGYYVDYVESRSAGITNFSERKQSIIIMDVPALPPHPERMFKLFRVYRRNPIILIAASRDEETRIYPYMQQGVYDIVQLPLKPAYLHFILRRLVEHSHLVAHNEFVNSLLALIVLSIPIWILLLIVLAAG